MLRERSHRGARARGILLLRLRIHAVAEANDAAEHRDRRRGRRVSAARRLGGDDGSIDLIAVYLFLIVFYWTPPHFWALALLKQRDYNKAGVPMAPLVWGERETMRQMLAYAVISSPSRFFRSRSGRSDSLSRFRHHPRRILLGDCYE